MSKINFFKNLFKPAAFEFEMPSLGRMELQDVQKSYARVFGSEDGKKVLAHLHKSVFMRALPSEASDEQIRYAEGQRAIIAQILRHIVAGRSA